MSAHAKLRPSAANRWLICTKSAAAEAELPDKPSPYAEEGSRAHALAERLARAAVGLPAKTEDPEDPADVPAEMTEAAEEYAMYVKEAYLAAKDACPDTVIDTEIRLDLSDWIPEGFGTADCLIVADGTLHVIDFKYGKGVKVEAASNRQLMIYALGALDWASLIYDVETVRMAIVQPRAGGITEAEIPADGLVKWGEDYLRPIAEAAAAGEGVFYPTEDACRFCKAAGSCKARADYFLKLFDDNQDTGLMLPDEIGKLLSKAAGMRDWLNALEARVKDTLLDGGKVGGWKLVAGRSRRQYTDEAEIEKRLRAKKYKVSDIYEKKLLGITKMEKLLGKKKMEELIGDLIEKPEGAPTLAPASDSRPELHLQDEIVAAFDEE